MGKGKTKKKKVMFYARKAKTERINYHDKKGKRIT